ncbi:hypothetical protein CDL15_Pgr026905 [Punica granatum]|uniref:Uncharacterized protein n=1 Tax=Punica granatum TaxID=22663 RepID=A0A218WNJ2_PUNGR|nr:hypothetical protein CDL15_Pgr026905 [Punica granatum]
MRMDKLEDALRRAAELVVICSEKSYLYMVAILSMVAIRLYVAHQFRQLLVAIEWAVESQFRQLQADIDNRAKAVGANPLVEEFRMEHLKEVLKAIKADNRKYSLDGEEFMVHMAILKPDRIGEDANAVENALSRAYPNLSLRDALKAERSKMQIEHSRSEDAGRCRLIVQLIGITDSAANDRPSRKVKKLLVNEPTCVISGYISNASEMNEDISWKVVEVDGGDEWRANPFDCCAESYLSPVAEAFGKSTSLKEELDESLAKVASLETFVKELKQKFAKAENKASQALSDNELLLETNLQLKRRVDELQELLNSAASDMEATA